MKKTALAIMAAGVGSRFGNGIKQACPVGPKGEIIMDYSIRDALEAGLTRSYLLSAGIWKKNFVLPSVPE